ncbi:hypothetical protein ACWCPA_36050, partial [Streptomyces tubercidicus]
MLTSTVCAAVSAAGLGIAAITAYRKRFLAATRIAAYSLIPIGLVMTGVIDWVTGIVFKPVVWAGFGVLALSVVLFMTTRAVERRRGGAGSRKERRLRHLAPHTAGCGLLREGGQLAEGRVGGEDQTVAVEDGHRHPGRVEG